MPDDNAHLSADDFLDILPDAEDARADAVIETETGDQPKDPAARALLDRVRAMNPAGGEQGDPEPEAAGRAPREDYPEGAWERLLEFNKKSGERLPTLHNAAMVLTNDERLKNKIRLNTYSKRVDLAEGIDFEAAGMAPLFASGAPLTPPERAAVLRFLHAPEDCGGAGVKVSLPLYGEAILEAARSQCYHPVRDYLGSLEWDKEKRLERFAIDFLGVNDDAYGREVITEMMVAAVARIENPGVQWDNVIVLEGPNGARKTTTLESLAAGCRGGSQILTKPRILLDDKLFTEKSAGRAFLILDEMAIMKSGDDHKEVLAAITQKAEQSRAAYGHWAEETSRSFIMVGTAHHTMKYLPSGDGARRFWPVRMQVPEGFKIDIEAIEKIREQLWAEAVSIYRERLEGAPRDHLGRVVRMPIGLLSPAAARILEGLQGGRMADTGNVYLRNRILEALSGNVKLDRFVDPMWRTIKVGGELVSVQFDYTYDEMAEKVLGRPASDLTASERKELGQALDDMAWISGGQEHSKRVAGRKVKVRRVDVFHREFAYALRGAVADMVGLDGRSDEEIDAMEIVAED